jgi:hypothetical protein
MSTFNDNEPLSTTDETSVEREPAPAELPADIEAPEADALEQATEVRSTAHANPVDRALEVPEGDAIEQALEVTPDEDE